MRPATFVTVENKGFSKVEQILIDGNFDEMELRAMENEYSVQKMSGGSLCGQLIWSGKTVLSIFGVFGGILGVLGVDFANFEKCQISFKNAQNLLKMASFHVFLLTFLQAKSVEATFVGQFG